MVSWSACYRPSETLCTDNCNADTDAKPTDGAFPDGTADGPTSFATCVNTDFSGSTGVMVAGRFYARNTSDFALFVDPTQTITQISTVGGMANPITFNPSASEPPINPVISHLTDGGKPEAFFVGVSGLFRSTHITGAVWNQPELVSTSGATIDGSFAMGQPDNNNPRHTVASSAMQLYEGQEANGIGGPWTFSVIAVAGASAPVQPSLSKDGLVMAFIDDVAINDPRVYVAKRPDLTSAFTVVQEVARPPNATGDPEFPRFGPLCDLLFVSYGGVVFQHF